MLSSIKHTPISPNIFYHFNYVFHTAVAFPMLFSMQFLFNSDSLNGTSG